MAIEVLSEGKEEVVQSKDTVESPVKKLSYPKSLANNPAHSNYLVFHVVEAMAQGDLTGRSLQSRRTNFLKNPAAMKSIGMIQMYMPAMMENLDHDYAANQTSLLGDLADAYMNTPGEHGLKRVMDSSGEMGQRVVERIEQTALNNATAVQQTGQIQGQRQSLLYGGTQLRSQNFMFTLRARNLAELKAIGEIIYMFRRYSSGTIENPALDIANTGSDTFGTVKVPPVWFVEERTKGSRPRSIDKFMMGPASITNVRVNKTPDQLYQSISGTSGDPVSIELEISLKEMVPCYSDFWDNLRRTTTTGLIGVSN